MNDFLFARSQMAMSLAFHIVFAALGIGMPLLMAIAEGMYLRTKQPVYLYLCQRWAKGTAILFAVGAVSGTVLSFELGLLWPKFMEHAGAVIGMPFSLEGFAFFTEAIFLGVYLYGWKRVPPLIHWLSGVLVVVSGILSGIFVVTANAWMNSPTGFKVIEGHFVDVDPIAAMLNRASFHEVVHMTLAAFVATGYLVAAVHAFFLLHDRTNFFHRAALGIALCVACVCTPLQILSGDLSARAVARLQPAKLAAMEAHYQTEAKAPLLIGGIPNDQTMTTAYALGIPRGLSLLIAHDPNAKVVGLEEFPRDQWPNVQIVHWSFDVMVGSGVVMLVLTVCVDWLWLKRRRLPDNTWLLRGLLAAGPLGFLAIETGWVVTEMGRQPWIIYGVMRTHEAVTPMPGLVVPFVTFTVVYIFLAGVVVALLRRLFLETASGAPDQPAGAAHA
ncbi:MAG TPA: cytochrome ubiquinol oxidase subunit I [Candidatus Binatia bacterium]|jgi:cytochrome d ubiquinol oxidase subunit I|nr:cytochrome ubiquinol oxidase subunit I [Candidatus Binatia bacterium]